LDLAGHLERRGPGSRPGWADGWLASWQSAEAAAAEAIAVWLAALGEPFEGQAFAGLGTVLPDDVIVLAGNSMPVRDMEAFLGTGPAAIRCLGNRGANGIDGLVSTALGAGAATGQPVVAVVGDVSFLHDLNALVAATRLGLSVTVILINNDGGGIFSFLPQAASVDPGVGLPQHFEELFGTPHGLDFGPLVQALGARHQRIPTSEVAEAVRALLVQPGVRVLEVRTDRVRNVELHRSVQAAVAAAVTGGVATQLGPESQHGPEGQRP
jgi:2-succinyl-5-enolpyruvyl-6-hydroxy-3-cyclohexene-1-carboxylate synthase